MHLAVGFLQLVYLFNEENTLSVSLYEKQAKRRMDASQPPTTGRF